MLQRLQEDKVRIRAAAQRKCRCNKLRSYSGPLLIDCQKSSAGRPATRSDKCRSNQITSEQDTLAVVACVYAFAQLTLIEQAGMGVDKV